MLDDQLTPYLIEVNTSPSMSSSSPIDKQIKSDLLAGAMNVIGPPPTLISFSSLLPQQLRVAEHGVPVPLQASRQSTGVR